MGFLCCSRAADVLFDSFAADGRLKVNQFFEVFLTTRHHLCLQLLSQLDEMKGHSLTLAVNDHQAIWGSGLHRSDPRLRECFFHLRKLQDAEGSVDRNTFHRFVLLQSDSGTYKSMSSVRQTLPATGVQADPCVILTPVFVLVASCCRCVTGFVSLTLKALQGRFVIPDFSTFIEETQKLFSRCRQLSSVQVSSAPAGQECVLHQRLLDLSRASLFTFLVQPGEREGERGRQ